MSHAPQRAWSCLLRPAQRYATSGERAHAVSAPFKLVPLEPTPEMIDALPWSMSGKNLGVAAYGFMLAAAPTQAAPPEPIPMILHCPACGLQHVDKAATDAEYSERLFESSWWELGGDKPERWTNPPHRSHLCHGCRHIWRPADVPTTGVAAIATKGKNDSHAAQEGAPRVVQPLTRDEMDVLAQKLIFQPMDRPTLNWVVTLFVAIQRACASKWGLTLKSDTEGAQHGSV